MRTIHFKDKTAQVRVLGSTRIPIRKCATADNNLFYLRWVDRKYYWLTYSIFISIYVFIFYLKILSHLYTQGGAGPHTPISTVAGTAE